MDNKIHCWQNACGRAQNVQAENEIAIQEKKRKKR